MSQPWTRLAAPFPEEALRWHVVEISPERVSARLAAHLDAVALRERLDRVLGVGGWSLRLRPWGERALVAELEIGNVAKSAVVRLARAGDEPEATAAAFSAAAEPFGMRPPRRAAPETWVDADPDSGEPLHPPETVPDAPPSVGGNGPEASLEGGVGADAAPGGAAEDAAADAVAEAPKPEAQRVIDRLMERLRDEGLGAAAARLVTAYGGYGNTVAESRELYARLRKLLLEQEERA